MPPVAEGTLFDGAAEVGGPPTLRVGELAQRIAKVTAATFPGDLWVEGQIRNLSRSPSGHAYFDLAEPVPAGEAPRAQVAVTLLAPERRFVNDQLTRAGGAVRMEDGIEVRIRGRLRWYAPRGTLQLRMSGIDPTFTLGRLQADRERTLAALAADGLLDANRARRLPLVPLRIGLITSVGSAAHADVLAELTASGLGFTVRVADARTQGIDCAPSVVAALARLAADGVDAVLLVRGGGARTDLAAFDHEVVPGSGDPGTRLRLSRAHARLRQGMGGDEDGGQGRNRLASFCNAMPDQTRRVNWQSARVARERTGASRK